MSGASHKNERSPGKKRQMERERYIKEGFCRAAKSPSTFPGHWSVSQCLSQTHRSPPSTLHERESLCFCFCSVFFFCIIVVRLRSCQPSHSPPNMLLLWPTWMNPSRSLVVWRNHQDLSSGSHSKKLHCAIGGWCYWTDGRDLVQSEKEERQFTARRTEMSAPIVRQKEINGIQVGGFIFLGAHITSALSAGLNPIEWRCLTVLAHKPSLA